MLKVLIVEDDADDARVMQLLMEKNKFQALIARDSTEALDRLSEEPDLVLLDIKLPGMWGDKLLMEMKRRNYGGPVIAVTGVPETLGIIAHMKIVKPSLSCVQKPFEEAELMQEIRKHIPQIRA